MTAIVLISFDPAAWPEQRGGTVGAVSSAGTFSRQCLLPCTVLVVLVGLCIVWTKRWHCTKLTVSLPPPCHGCKCPVQYKLGGCFGNGTKVLGKLSAFVFHFTLNPVSAPWDPKVCCSIKMEFSMKLHLPFWSGWDCIKGCLNIISLVSELVSRMGYEMQRLFSCSW